MSIKKNVIANYIGQIYIASIAILALPFYMKHMGSEAYGLIGFFTMTQAWFGLLDFGLKQTISRETARYNGGAITALEYRQLYRALSTAFILIAVVGGGIISFSSELIVSKWLTIEKLNVIDVELSIQIIAVIVSLRWTTSLYRGIITGNERFVWLTGFDITISSLRFIAVFWSMQIYGYTPNVFFLHQLFIATIEILGMFLMSKLLLPPKKGISQSIGWSFTPLKKTLRFSLSIAVASAIWVFVTQTDKLVLSGILSLSDYGNFTLAVLVASGIMVMGTPIGSAIMPRLTRLNTEGKNNELITLYRNSTQLVSTFVGSLAITVSLFAEQLIFAWTGDENLSSHTAPILRLYAIGNGLLALTVFPYYLQYAKGNLRLHLIGNILLIALLIPTIIIATKRYGGIGAGYVWMTTNALYLLFWVAYAHSLLFPGLHKPWIINDIFFILAPATTAALVLKQLTDLALVYLPSDNRILMGLIIFITGVIVAAAASCGSSLVRGWFLHKLHNALKKNYRQAPE